MTLKITQTRSLIHSSLRQRRTIKALGIRRIGHSVEKADSPAMRGMIRRVSHLVRMEELQ